MAANSLFYEKNERIDVVHPISSSTVVQGAWVPVAGFDEIIVHWIVGLIAATGVFNLDVNQATDASGTGAKNVTDAAGNNMAITALADSDDDVDGLLSILPVHSDQGANHMYAL